MTNLKLVSYLKHNLKKGYERGELENILIKHGWPKKELDLAFNLIFKEKKEIKKNNIKHLKPKQSKKDPLLNFIKESIDNGISEKQIRWALAVKGWEKGLVDESFKKVKFPIIKQQEEEKPQKPERQKIDFNFKKIFLYFVSFLIISTILSGTSMVFLYIQGVSNYTINDNSGNEITGACMVEGCSDMREFAINYAYENIFFWAILGIVLALIAVLLHLFLPFKNGLIWTYNIIYFIYILIILYYWFRFRMG